MNITKSIFSKLLETHNIWQTFDVTESKGITSHCFFSNNHRACRIPLWTFPHKCEEKYRIPISYYFSNICISLPLRKMIRKFEGSWLKFGYIQGIRDVEKSIALSNIRYACLYFIDYCELEHDIWFKEKFSFSTIFIFFMQCEKAK